MYETSLKKNFCSCKAWQFQKMPVKDRNCKHLIALREFPLKKSKKNQYIYVNKPEFMLLAQKVPKKKLHSADYLFSRKYDGIRVKVSKDGKMITRKGVVVNLPTLGTFSHEFDAELCMCEKFEQGHTIVMNEIDKNQMDNLIINVFDFWPTNKNETYTERYETLLKLQKTWPEKIHLVKQYDFETSKTLQDNLPSLMDKCLIQGLEGIVVRKKDGKYNFNGQRRNLILFKVKV